MRLGSQFVGWTRRLGAAHEAAQQPFVPQTWESGLLGGGSPPEEAGVGVRLPGSRGYGVSAARHKEVAEEALSFSLDLRVEGRRKWTRSDRIPLETSGKIFIPRGNRRPRTEAFKCRFRNSLKVLETVKGTQKSSISQSWLLLLFFP